MNGLIEPIKFYGQINFEFIFSRYVKRAREKEGQTYTIRGSDISSGNLCIFDYLNNQHPL